MGKESCDCLNFCGDDIRVSTGEVRPCTNHHSRREIKKPAVRKNMEVRMLSALPEASSFPAAQKLQQWRVDDNGVGMWFDVEIVYEENKDGA